MRLFVGILPEDATASTSHKSFKTRLWQPGLMRLEMGHIFAHWSLTRCLSQLQVRSDAWVQAVKDTKGWVLEDLIEMPVFFDYW